MSCPRSRLGATRHPATRTRTPARTAWPWALAAIFAAALAWRLPYLARLADSPLGGSRIADAQSYWDWSSYLLAHGPVGKNPFFLAPLYPYVLAALRLVLGPDPQRVLFLQALWGSLAAVLLADSARRLTRPALGLAVGLLVAFSSMATFFDGLVLAESLLFCIAAGLAWAVALAWQTAAAKRDALCPAAVTVFAFALVCAPAALRSAAVSHEWIPFTYNPGYNLYVGNGPIANGSFISVTGTHDITDTRFEGEDGGIEGDGRRFIEETRGLRLGATASSRWWARRAIDWMSAHPSRTAGLWLRKLAMAWSQYESPQIENVDEFRLLAGPVGMPWLESFAVLAALAMAGMFVAWTRGARERFFALYVALASAALVPFFVTDRYRHQLVPGALMLAAIAADATWRSRRVPGQLALPAAGALLGLALALWPVPHLAPGRYAVSLAADVGMRWLDRGRADLAEPELAHAVTMDQQGRVHWMATSDDSLNRAELYANHARALTRIGRAPEALMELRRAATLAPGSRAIALDLAAAYVASGDEVRAARLYAQTGQPGGIVDAAVARGWSLARAGDLAGADSAFADAVSRDRSRYAAWGALVRLRTQAGRRAEARLALERGHAAGWSGATYDAHAALELAGEGDAPAARRLLAGIPPAALASDPVLADVVRAVRGLLGE